MDDLTASHWDDVLSPAVKFSPPKFASLSTDFAGINLNPHADDDNADIGDSSSDKTDSSPNQANSNSLYSPHFQASVPPDLSLPPTNYGEPSVFNQDEVEQLSELKREERKEHRSQLLQELTSGADTLGIEKPLVETLDPTESLFNDNGTKALSAGGVMALASESLPNEAITSPSKSSQLKTGQFKPIRKRRYAPLKVAKHLSGSQPLESNPLGPLSSRKSLDTLLTHDGSKKSNSLLEAVDAPLYNITPDAEDSRPELSTLQLPAHASSKNDDAQADYGSNELDITVGNPVKVGDIATAHIVYDIKTRNKNPSSQHFLNNTDTVAVSRRYKDFRWVYRQLQSNHPGKIVPPPPTKQTYIGRFNENFIENRRLSLEKMLVKISKVPAFANDPDFGIFLTSADLANLVKEREQSSGAAPFNDLDDESSTSSAPAVVSGAASSGFMSSLFSMTTKPQEPDEFFSKKKSYIDDLEHNLKTFYKSLELIAQQRADIIMVIDEISATIDALADLEILKVTTELLRAFAEVQIKLKENLERVNLQDQLTLGFTIEEYLRIIGSVKFAFDTRTNIYTQFNQLNQELQKKQDALDKLNMKYKSSQEKRSMLSFETDKLKQKVAHFEKSFESISETIKEELDNFEIEKIEDFRNSIEIFIESSIESQKEAIELWETFYERQHLDKL